MPSVPVCTLLFKHDINEELAAIDFACERKSQHYRGTTVISVGLCEQTMLSAYGMHRVIWGEDGKKAKHCC